MSKKIVILGLAMVLLIGSITPMKTSALVTPNYVEEIVTRMLETRFSNIEKDIVALKTENLSLREEIRLLKERIAVIEKSAETTPTTITPTTPSVDNSGIGVVITKKYTRYKNSVEVYDATTGRHISWGEAMNYNIWNDIQDLPYTKPLN